MRQQAPPKAVMFIQEKNTLWNSRHITAIALRSSRFQVCFTPHDMFWH